MIHDGHLNIIKEAQKYGKVIIGVLSDEAMVRFNRFPGVSFSERFHMIEKLEGVSKVVVQKEIMYDQIIQELHPDYVIHGDNWRKGPMKAIRENVVHLLDTYGGQVIDVPYTYSKEVKRLDVKMKEKLSMPEYRRKRLKQLITLCPIVKAIEVHSGLTGLIAEKTVVANGDELDQLFLTGIPAD